MNFDRAARHTKYLIAGFCFALAAVGRAQAADFCAYYTRINSGEAFEKVARVGDDADIVVQLAEPQGRLVFWRGTSYLPYWETAKGKWPLTEIVPRHGDGTAKMPDRVNIYSHVELIESNPEKIVVLWRYLPQFTAGNPHGDLDTNNFVEELFTVTPDGRLVRTVKQGTKTIDEWNEPRNRTTQVVKLAAAGIEEVSCIKQRRESLLATVQSNPMKGPPPVAPRAWFKFDEGQGETTQEAISGINVPVRGHKVLWKKGVSGTALEFDGYRSVVALPAEKAPAIRGDISVEGWFALGAYPWNWAPIVQQGDNEGFFLGVDSHGYPGFMAQIGGTWQVLNIPGRPPYKDDKHIDLFRWHHLAGTYGKADGTMRLYLDGKEITHKPVGPGGAQPAAAELRIGKAGIGRAPTQGTHDTLLSDFGLDALIDEVRVYDTALTAEQVSASYKAFDPGQDIARSPDMQRRELPNPNTGGEFKAVYTHLPYYETWENLWRFGPYPDIVVGFDRLPTKFVFWRGVSYIPMLVNESNQWYSNEFNETGFTAGAPGDCEPMSDKSCWDSHVRVIERSPARVVVHWRYRLSNPQHHWAYYNAATGWGDICDWHYYIYPDGVAVKRMQWYSSDRSGFQEWDEQMAILGEGQHPESVVRKSPVMTLVDAAGKATPYDWNPDPPRPDYKNKIIQMIHFKGRYSPFSIQKFDGGDIYGGERTWYSVFPTWNHWPTSQINSSGRNASFPDRAAHTSISHLFWPYSARVAGPAGYDEKILMEGMTDQSPASLVPLAKSWLEAPALEAISDCRACRYDAAQRAYLLDATGPAPSFRVVGSPKRPIVNLCFVVRGVDAADWAVVQIDSRLLTPGPKVRQGIVRDRDGRPMLVVWVECSRTAPTTFVLHLVRLQGPGNQLPSGNPPTYSARSARCFRHRAERDENSYRFAGPDGSYCFVKK